MDKYFCCPKALVIFVFPHIDRNLKDRRRCKYMCVCVCCACVCVSQQGAPSAHLHQYLLLYVLFQDLQVFMFCGTLSCFTRSTCRAPAPSVLKEVTGREICCCKYLISLSGLFMMWLFFPNSSSSVPVSRSSYWYTPTLKRNAALALSEEIVFRWPCFWGQN